MPALCKRASEGVAVRQLVWGQGDVSPSLAHLMGAITNKLGHWVALDEDTLEYVPFKPFPTPPNVLKDLDFWRRKAQDERKQIRIAKKSG